MSSQQQNSITLANSYEEFLQLRKELCFKVALAEQGGRYKTWIEKREVQRKCALLFAVYTTEEHVLELERRLFQNV